jgi:sulfite reductase (NADPH) hemoprotein beta-component
MPSPSVSWTAVVTNCTRTFSPVSPTVWVSVVPAVRGPPEAVTVTEPLVPTGMAKPPPGDVTAEQMEVIADLADRYSFGELRVSHEHNVILADVRLSDLFAVWQAAKSHGLATPNIGLLTNIISCPGGDFCSLANAKSIPIAEAIQRRFDDLDYLHDIGELDLNISGCMNSCGHHHVGHIGILGVDKQGSEWYQVSIGGRQGREAALGDVIGPSFAAADMPDVVSRLIETYLEHRHEDELFVDTVHRLGVALQMSVINDLQVKSFYVLVVPPAKASDAVRFARGPVPVQLIDNSGSADLAAESVNTLCGRDHEVPA